MTWVRKTPMPDVEVQTAPAPTTIQAALAGGAVPGTILAAPLAPSSGPIPGPEPVAGTKDTPGRQQLVVVAVQSFWQSKTVKALRNAVGYAIGLALLVVAVQIVSAGGDLWDVNWQTTQKAAIAAGAFSLASAYAAYWKNRDNNPIAGGPK